MLSRAGTAVFEPGISFHFFFLSFHKTGRMVGDDSSLKTLLVAVSHSTHSHSFLHTNFGVCVCVCFRQCDKAIFPLCLLLLRNVVLIDSL